MPHRPALLFFLLASFARADDPDRMTVGRQKDGRVVVPTNQVLSPAGTQVLFRMRVTVPDQPGRQQVRWALDGPHEMPGFTGLVEVTPR